MTALQPAKSYPVGMLWLGVALAYVLIAAGLLAVGDLDLEADGGVIIYVAAACYLLGGLLILARRRWLWLIGLLMNGLVILFFLQLYRERQIVMFSPGAIITKAAQLLLELNLVYLIVADWLAARVRPS